MLKLRDIMTREVITVSPDLSIRDAMDLLATRHVSGVPVVVGEVVLGVVSTTDLLGFAATLPGAPDQQSDEEEEEPRGWEEGSDPPAAYFGRMWDDADTDVRERFEQVSGATRSALEDHVVSEVMTRNVLSLPSTTDVRVAADFMRRANVHRLLVVDHGRLCGIVSVMDITRAAADGRLTAHRYVFNKAPSFEA
ncbi:MAG TPA: CBS domain-containing protein [Gemmatimonadaceae bacterium]|nr:CBS domain-containing protein [Gemmatimonadaceae bacterium]